MISYLILVGSLFFYMNVWFVLSLYKKRNDLADVAWGLGFVFLSWLSFFIFQPGGLWVLVVNFFVTVWGIRLAWHICRRNIRKNEDYRYKQWRQDWGKWFYFRSYVQIYILQGFLMFIIFLPVLLVNRSGLFGLSVLGFLGVAVWVLGFSFEAVGDFQLERFISDKKNKGQLMQSGLWAYTRHPNYFGEVCQWWGIWIIALSVPGGLISVLSPITITFLILVVSGIPMLEKKMSQHPDFSDYKKRTSVFIPLPRKKYV